MAIKYLDAKRIRGSSTGVKPTTHDGWSGTKVTDGTQVTESGGVVTYDITTRVGNHTVSNDLGSNLSDSEWVMRCKLDYTTITGGGTSTVYFELGIGSANANTEFSNGGLTSDFIGLQNRVASGSSDLGWGCVDYINGDPYLLNPESPVMDTDPNTSTTYYVEIKRLSTTSMSIGLYDSADFDSLIMPIETRTIPSACNNLRYLRVGNATVGSESSTGNVLEGTVRDFQIWNATTSATQDDKATLVTAGETAGNAWSFSGGKVTLSHQFLPVGTSNNWSLAMWIRFNNFSDSDELLREHTTNFELWRNTNGLNITNGESAPNNRIKNQANLAVDTWYHVTLTNNNGSFKVYWNGLESNTDNDVTGTTHTIGTVTSWTLAGRGDSNNEPHHGLLGQVLMYNDVLTDAEVLTLYGGGSGTKTPSTSNLVTHYDFQETSGTTLTDRVGSNNGSLSGSADLTNDGVFATSDTSDLPENTLFEETDTRKIYGLESAAWERWYPAPITYMAIMGGASGDADDIQRITIATLGNSVDFGEMHNGVEKPAGVSNESRGCACGGEDPNETNDIQYITIGTAGNAATFGDLTGTAQRSGGVSSKPDDRGIIGGGIRSSNSNVIDYFAISSTGNAADFGDLTQARSWVAGCWSDVRGCFCNGYTSTDVNTIDYITMATLGNATDFGDTTVGSYSSSALTSKTRGVICGGYDEGITSNHNVMNYITIATTGNATDFGDLMEATQNPFAGGDLEDRGLIAGGNGLLTRIQYITISTAGNAASFGSLVNGKHDGCTVNGS